MKKFNFCKLLMLLAVLSFSITSAVAQSDAPFNDLPPQPNQFGKCYAKCKIPDQYENVDVTVLVKEASTKKSTVPAEYETITEQILVKEASTKLVPVPAEYETVTEQVLIKDASTKLTPVPAVYETVTEQVLVKEASTKIVTKAPKYTTTTERVLVKPAYGEWIRKKRAPECFSSNPDDCYVLCWVERPAEYKTVTKQILADGGGENVVDVPAQYKTVTRRVLKTPATTKETIIPAQYKTITKKVLRTPASVREEVIPAQYKTITKRVLKSSARTEAVTVPAEYKTITEKRLVRSGGYTQWVEILCAQDTNSGVVRQVQQALKDKGYDPGPVDGVMGVKTTNALSSYQRDHGLPVGNMNKETLRHMGLNY